MASVGTLGHKICEQMLTGEPVALDEEDEKLIAKLETDQRTWFKKAITQCVDYIRSEHKRYVDEHSEHEVTIEFEQKIKSEIIDEHGGTCDVSICTPNILHAYDFKFGSHAVDAENNEQVMCYINLARERNPGRNEFFGTIIQPAYRGAQTFEYTEQQLDVFRRRAVAATKSKDRNGDPSWCEWCPLLQSCSAAGKLTVGAVEDFGTLMDFINEGEGPTPENVEKLERIVMMHRLARNAYEKAAALLKDWYNRGGVTLKHNRMAKTNIRSWSDRALLELADQLDADELTEAVTLDLISPPKLQKLLNMNKKEFDEKYRPLMILQSRPQLKAGAKPSPHELANDLPIISD